MSNRQQAEEIVRTVLLDAGCDFMAEDSVKFVAAKIDAKDATIARLESENAALREREAAWIEWSNENNEHFDELNKLCDTFGPNTNGETYHGFLTKHIAKLRERAEGLARECVAWREYDRRLRNDLADHVRFFEPMETITTKLVSESRNATDAAGWLTANGGGGGQ